MNNLYKDTAILLFSRSHKAETEEKQLMSRTDRCLQVDIYHDLIAHTRKIVENTGIDYYFIDERKQYGTTFGEKFTSAFAQIFEKGYRYVISIGNDCPQLTSGAILEAAELFRKNEIVLGPAQDGGDYLIGISSSVFNTCNLLDLPWETDRVHHTLVRKFKKNKLNVAELEVLSDIDDYTDLKAHFYLLKKLFIRLNATMKRLIIEKESIFNSPLINFNFFQPFISPRAPPLYTL